MVRALVLSVFGKATFAEAMGRGVLAIEIGSALDFESQTESQSQEFMAVFQK